MISFKQGQTSPLGGKMYRKKTIVRLVRMNEPFLCESREGTLVGQTGDFLAEDGHGGFYPISNEFHAANYVEADSPPSLPQPRSS